MTQMKKTLQVVMLPTNEKANKGDIIGNNKGFAITDISLSLSMLGLIQAKVYKLYFLSDEEIKEGDWYYQHNPYGSVIDRCDNKSPFVAKSARYIWENGGKKIIATTDKSLVNSNCCIAKEGLTKMNEGCRDRNRCLMPQPSQSFIEKYVEEYNKGNVITEVEVEYEEIVGLNEGFGSYS